MSPPPPENPSRAVSRGTVERGVLADFAAQLSTLAQTMRLSASALDERPAGASGNVTDLKTVAEELLRDRHARQDFLPQSLFHEPAWELLLCLYAAHRRSEVLSVKQLVSLVQAPVTTSQRWIDQLVHMKLVRRLADPTDRRRMELSLEDSAVKALESYLKWVVENRS